MFQDFKSRETVLTHVSSLGERQPQEKGPRWGGMMSKVNIVGRKCQGMGWLLLVVYS